ncbi:MAG TPA: DUF433 domain-containing protein [Candidatus Hydrogenedentes bacterium]|nr:DUF433 domain-containing protein [Candidatus Hydrogenedentota bacterium]HNT88498.1 DUF433 domain-containing protein [Candidatus Hydrogenedentota bacterium]
MSELLERIAVNPNICHGQPCIKGTRIMVWLILQYLSNGDSADDILAAYPSLTMEDIQACLAYAAESARERILPIEVQA